jgi:hypothetical protein
MKIPEPRGPISSTLFTALAHVPGSDEGAAAVEELRLLATPRAAASTDIVGDDDVQLALFCLYELHYSGLEGVSDEWEWEPGLIQVRRLLERPFEVALRTAAASAAGEINVPAAAKLSSVAVAPWWEKVCGCLALSSAADGVSGGHGGVCRGGSVVLWLSLWTSVARRASTGTVDCCLWSTSVRFLCFPVLPRQQ